MNMRFVGWHEIPAFMRSPAHDLSDRRVVISAKAGMTVGHLLCFKETPEP